MCNSETLPGIFSIVKRIMSLIQIVVPILLIVFASLSLIKLLKNPEEKNGTKKIINQFIAAVIVFFIPLLVDVVMNLAGDSNEISSCWMSANDKNIINTKYQSSGEKEKKKITYDATDYEAGRGELDFSCTSDTVKSQFSCETLKIVEKHLYDFDATNFNSVINNKYGGFDNYVKSVGGIFDEYYGKKMPNETEADFQRAAEYVLGWMYMYGWEYMNHGGRRSRCRGNDCFYAKGGFEGKFISDSGIGLAGLGKGNDLDHVISGKNGGPGRMASECGNLESFTFNKLGIEMKNWKLTNYTKFKDLKVGDALCMWNSNGGGHNVMVGEVYSDRVVFYDAGSYYPNTRNYKRVAYLPKEDSVEADREVLKKVFYYYDGWGTRRHYNFKRVINNKEGSENMCNSETLPGIFSIVKRIILLIQIIVPILLIVFASLSLIKLLKNPEEKNGTKKIINQFIAAIIVFFIPLLVDVVMNLAGDSNEISSCWMSASDKNIINTKYQSSGEKERKKITYDAKEYEAGRGELDFSCTSNIVKSQFSCETLKIVEKHLYDFDATNFNSVINNKYGGDFGTYTKSVGGIFGEYYGKQMPNETESDFQRAAEYVLGWMYMYGWDYMNTGGEHYKWGTGSKYSNDAFYANGGWKREYSGKFDDLIAGKNGLDMLSSECGDLEIFIYWKLGLSRKKTIKSPTSLRDLKVGDAIFFYDKKGEGKNWRHTALVGEVYDDRIVCYDAGSRYTRSRNYKYTVEIPNDTSAAAELTALKKHYAYDGWIAKRYYNFKAS